MKMRKTVITTILLGVVLAPRSAHGNVMLITEDARRGNFTVTSVDWIKGALVTQRQFKFKGLPGDLNEVNSSPGNVRALFSTNNGKLLLFELSTSETVNLSEMTKASTSGKVPAGLVWISNRDFVVYFADKHRIADSVAVRFRSRDGKLSFAAYDNESSWASPFTRFRQAANAAYSSLLSADANPLGVGWQQEFDVQGVFGCLHNGYLGALSKNFSLMFFRHLQEPSIFIFRKGIFERKVDYSALTDSVSQMMIEDDGKLIFLGNGRNCLIIDAATGKLLKTMPCRYMAYSCYAFRQAVQ
ncbi:MAG: hypothetical protein JST35_07505 [Armatimonadetes bacterium]|nr:hypothetical protein [Armatimonadota bacterium]